MAVGTCPTVRSSSVSLPIAVTVCKSPSAEPVDVWTTQARCPQAHRRSNNNRPEQNEKCVTHVAGQICYPCPRLHSEGDLDPRSFVTPHPTPLPSGEGAGLNRGSIVPCHTTPPARRICRPCAGTLL